MAKSDHVDIVRSGNSTLNSWRISNPEAVLDLRCAKFDRLDLSSSDFSGALMDSVEFTECKLKNAVFDSVNLCRAKLKNCSLDGATFEGANISRAEFLGVTIEGTKFGDSSTISHVGKLEYLEPKDHPLYQANSIPFYDKFFSWDKIRFLKDINIFVPSYGALVLSVLYLNVVSLYNASLSVINGMIAKSPELLDLQEMEPAEPGVRYLWMLAAFSMLALASTLFLACPSRIGGYTKEQWNSELGRATLGYDLSAWSLRPLRILCCICFVVGGCIAAALLVSAVFRQVGFIVSNIMSVGG